MKVLPEAPVAGSILGKFAAPRAYIYATLAGLITFAANYGIGAYLTRINLYVMATIVDDVLLGILVAIMIFGIEIQHQREIRRQQQKIAVMAAMNHHIRNALQAVTNVTYNAGDIHAVDVITKSSERIEWALRDILPNCGGFDLQHQASGGPLHSSRYSCEV